MEFVRSIKTFDNDVKKISAKDIENILVDRKWHCGYEYLRDTMIVKPYFDIDCKNNGDINQDMNVLDGCKKLLSQFFANAKYAISECNREEKISFHIVIVNYKTSIKALNALYSAHYQAFEKCYFDKSVYSSIRKFRMIYCAKDGAKPVEQPFKPITYKNSPLKHIIQYVEENAFEFDFKIPNKSNEIETKLLATTDSNCKADKNHIKYYCDSIDVKKLSHSDWIKLGMLLKRYDRFDLYDDISKRSEHYDNEGLLTVWKGLKKGMNLNIGTLCHYAKITNPNFVMPTSNVNNNANDEYIVIEHDYEGAQELIKSLVDGDIVASQSRYFYRKNKGINVYIEDTSRSKDEIRLQLRKIASSLNLCKQNSKHVIPYSRNQNGANNVANHAFDHLPNDDSFVDRLWNSNIGKLCFRNGYYEFNTKLFKPYDNKTITTICIDRDFPTDIKQADIDEVYNKVLNPILWDESQRKYFLNWISRGLAGKYDEKTWAKGIGLRNSGKGVLVDSIKTAFGNYVNIFNSEEITCTRAGNGDIAKKLAWIIPLEFSRLNFSNELKLVDDKNVRLKLDGEIIKRLSSGGDILKARQNYVNERELKLQGRFMFMANEDINVSSENAHSTSVTFNFRSEFTSDISLLDKSNDEFKYFKADQDIKTNLLKSDRYINAFIKIVIDSYTNDMLPMPQSIIENNQDASQNDESIDLKLRQIFEFSINDKIPVADLNSKISITFPQLSKTIVKLTLFKWGCINFVSNNVRYIKHIKFINNGTHN